MSLASEFFSFSGQRMLVRVFNNHLPSLPHVMQEGNSNASGTGSCDVSGCDLRAVTVC